MDHLRTVYGSGIAAEELARLGDVVVIADPVAWQICGDALPPPALFLTADSLERERLNGLVESVPPGLAVVGLGGGMAIDVSKYLAVRLGISATLVPTLTSSNAPFTDFISVRAGGSPAGMLVRGAQKKVVVDVDLLTRADARLNRAGYGDLLAYGSALLDWRAATGSDEGYDEEYAARIERLVDEAIDSATVIGAADAAGVERLMRLFEAGTRLLDTRPEAPMGAGSEHLFTWTAEAVTGRHLVHGELVALGIVITEFLTNGGRLREALETAHVKWRPGDVGLAWDEVETTLLSVGDYNRRVRHFDALVANVAWTRPRLEQLRALVTGLVPHGSEGRAS